MRMSVDSLGFALVGVLMVMAPEVKMETSHTTAEDLQHSTVSGKLSVQENILKA